MQEAPKTTKQSITSLYNRVADQYDRVGQGVFTVFGEQLVLEAQVKPGMRVLDIGTGRGAILIPARQALQNQGLAVGIDLAWEMVRRTRLELDSYDSIASVACMDGEHLGFVPASFDILLCGFAFFFLDPSRALPEWRRVLNPVGRLAISVTESIDPHWDWYEEQLVAFHKEHNIPLYSGQREVGEINRPVQIFEALRLNQFQNVQMVIHEFNFDYPDAETWWQSSGLMERAIPLEHIPADLLESFRQDVLARAEQTRLREHWLLACVIAER